MGLGGHAFVPTRLSTFNIRPTLDSAKLDRLPTAHAFHELPCRTHFEARSRDLFCLMSVAESAHVVSSFIGTRIWLHRPQIDVKRSKEEYPRGREYERAANGCMRCQNPRTIDHAPSSKDVRSVRFSAFPADSREQPRHRIDRLMRSRRERYRCETGERR